MPNKIPRYLAEAVHRGDRFKKELQAADPMTRMQLLGAWKEQIIADCIHVLKATDLPKDLAQIDTEIALLKELTELRRLKREKTKAPGLL